MKNDIKYIIKKIIIGVGIAIGVMLLKPVVGFAENQTATFYMYCSSFNSCVLHGQKSNIGSANYKYYKRNFTLKNYNGYDINIKFYDKTSSIKLLSFYNETTDNLYIKPIILSEDITSKIYITSNADNNLVGFYYYNSDNTKVFIQNGNPCPISLDNDGNSKDAYILNTTEEGHIFYGNNASNINRRIPYMSSIYQSEISNEIYIDGVLNGIVSKIPNNYKKIDMFGKYAVLFYPKDYRNIPVECTEYKDGVTTDEQGNVTIIPNQTCTKNNYKMTFYYNGYFNTGFANLSNMKKIEYPVEQLPWFADNEYELPLYIPTDLFNGKPITDADGKVHITKEARGGIIFYNNNISEITDADDNTTSYYNKGYIYYDDTLLNYIIIEDSSSELNEEISFIDNNGNTHNETITQLPGKEQTNTSDSNKFYDFFKNFNADTHGLSSIISAPLSFIKTLSNNTCSSLNIPIPFSKGQHINLPCMTDIYKNNFGQIYNIYSTIITGIIAYWVCVRLFTLIKGFKDPEDDKIEVVEL